LELGTAEDSFSNGTGETQINVITQSGTNPFTPVGTTPLPSRTPTLRHRPRRVGFVWLA
jgi:hypothetical protein